MTYDELVEKVARAICQADGQDPDLPCIDGCPPAKLTKEPLWRAGGYDAMARAALAVVYEALKEPSGAAVKTGTAARWASAIRDANNVREIWSAMLAASPLNPKGPTNDPHQD